MGLGDIKGVVEIIDRTVASQSFDWQMEEELVKKTEMKLLPRGLEKKLRKSEVTKGQFQFRNNEKCCREGRYEVTERCPLNLAAGIIDPLLTNSVS